MNDRIMATHVMRNALHWMKTATNQKLGALGEIYAKWWFVSEGWEAHHSVIPKQGDITIISKKKKLPIKVEVKTAKRDERGMYQFCLRKDGKTDISHSDHVLLMAIDNEGVLYRYLIPSRALGDRKKCTITSHPENYSGFLSKWLVK